jgi:iron complex transport system permease protein
MKSGRVIILLATLTLLLLSAGLSAGSDGWGWPRGDGADLVLWEIRAPRSLGAWLVGALLGLGGALAQGLFRNPLAEPFLLGAAPGATPARWPAMRSARQRLR